MGKKQLTIFTPVYNRANKISNLYQSLINQTNQDYMWMIVDDGSKDNIDDVVKSFIDENKIEIKYYKQENQGKHVAHNLGVSRCETDLFACVDSDDILLTNAVEEVLDYINKNQQALMQKSISGILAYRGYTSGGKIGNYPASTEPASLSDLYSKKGMTGDTFLIFKTGVIRKFPFPVFEGERFLRESISYDLMDREYKYLILRKILYLCEYCDDGLTRNASRLELKSPLGAALFRKHEADKAQRLKDKIRNLTAYVFFSRLGHNTKECRSILGYRYFLYWVLSFSGYIKYGRIMKEEK